MSKTRVSSSTADIRAEACAWIVQLETGDLTRADVEAFREWMQRSPQNAAETRRLARLSGDLNVLTAVAGPLRTAAAHYRAVIRPEPKPWRMVLPWVASFSVALVVVVGAWLIRGAVVSPSQEWPILLATEMGEHRQVDLPDGSTISMNTSSRLEMVYSHERRTVHLLRGEALFTVVSDPSRPFVVHAGDRTIEAVGTAFLVRLDAAAFEVAVTKGQVRLAELDTTAVRKGADQHSIEVNNLGSGSVAENHQGHDSSSINDPTEPDLARAGRDLSLAAPILLSAGQQFAVSTDDLSVPAPPPIVETITQREIQRKLAWQEGLLEFSETPLSEVISEVSRHTALKIEIADPALSKLKFGGIFRTGDTAPLFKALETAYGIHIEHSGKVVRLTRPNSG